MDLEELLSRGVEEIIIHESLEKKLKLGKKLRIKYGADPSRPDLHLGHTVELLALKKFQKAGHTIIFLIGDYTARIGDPSKRSKTRSQLTQKEIEENAQTYLSQVGKILDIKKLEIRKNSEWYDKLTLAELIKIVSNLTIARILERDDFEKRYKKGIPISLHEFLYPAMQGYDSIVLKSDLEVGGTDQKFNMLTGRELQEKLKEPPQDIMTFQLLEGTDGKEKMSKSLDNYIGIYEKPLEIYSKIMSIPDRLIIKYYILCTEISLPKIEKIKKEIEQREVNPRDTKADLALEIVKMYHGKEEAQNAADEFDRIFKMGRLPKHIPQKSLPQGSYLIVDLLVSTGLLSSKTQARHLIEQSGVKVDGNIVSNRDASIKIKNGMVLQIGKRKFVKVKIE
jgi:tyrosyl-tRNA synthetase